MKPSIVCLLDHSVLKPTQTADDVRAGCTLCRQLGTASICVKPSHVPLAAELLAGTRVAVSTVIGFPHGGTTSAAKVAEAHTACSDGATELDMVVNIGQVLERAWDAVEADIRAVVTAAEDHNAIVKVIFETGLLPDDAVKIRLCQISERAGAAFVKTSTGFGFATHSDGILVATGATEHDVRLMRANCSQSVGVKASGGIRSFQDAQRFANLGATRLGTSSTAAIAAEAEQPGNP